ncbi:Protein kinase domain-containing protein [Abeliophyllum distichum]|uniref:Protein kinase domain-containing protein n=1 Tax=Abeliophyllum distichum TaxID=126358 RepID=A0ABD1UJY0_9LAMI
MIATIKVFNLDLEGANKSFDTECYILCNIRHINLVKPSNTVLNANLIAHVADFGIAKLFTEDQRISLTKTFSTIGYMAPETLGHPVLRSTVFSLHCGPKANPTCRTQTQLNMTL